jgi:hypothetical protein
VRDVISFHHPLTQHAFPDPFGKFYSMIAGLSDIFNINALNLPRI